MKLDALKTFIRVTEKGSFSKSTEELATPQPTITDRIASPESHLSTRLFDHVGRDVHLTKASHLLLPAARKINSLISTVHKEIIPIERKAQGRLTIGISEYIEQDRIASLLKSYRDRCPDVELKLHPSSAEDILDKVHQGVFDLALCSTTSNSVRVENKENLCSEEIWSDNLRLVVEQAHDLAESDNVTFEKLCSYPSILPEYPEELRNVIDLELMKYNKTVSFIDVSVMAKIQSLVGCGLGWSILPESEIRDPLVGLNIDNFEQTHTVRLFRNSHLATSRAKEAFIRDCKYNCVNTHDSHYPITRTESWKHKWTKMRSVS